MDPEIKKALDELRAAVGEGSTEIQGRIDEIATAAEQRDADVKALRAQIEEIGKAHEERESLIREIQQRQRKEAIERDPIRSAREAMSMLGGICRQTLARKIGAEIPSRFVGEADQIRAYMERISLEADSGSGANTIPTLLSTSVFDNLEEVSSLLGMAEFIPNLPGKMDIPTITSRPTLLHKRTTTDTAMTAGSVGIGQVSFDPDEMYIFITADNRMLEMSAFDLGSLIYRLMREAGTEGLVNDLVNADGTATYNLITGFLNVSTAAYLYNMPAGKTSFGDLVFEHLAAIKGKALKRGRARGSWIMSYDILSLIMNIDRTGKPPIITFDETGRARVLMNPVEIDEGMPDLTDDAASKAFIGFGDLKEYVVGLTSGMAISASDQYLFGKNQTCFRLVLNGDIKRKGSKAFITAKTATA